MDSNHRTPKRTDLQSVAVGHLATCPYTRSQRRDSNPRPADYKSAALPTELLWLVTHFARRSPRAKAGPRSSTLPQPPHPNRQIHSTLIHCFFWEGKGRLKCQIQKF